MTPIYKGYSYTLTYRLFEADGTTPFDTTGMTIKFVVGAKEFDVTVNANEVTVDLTGTQTAGLSRASKVDIFLKLTLGSAVYRRGARTTSIV